jgi:hypothetical protein
MTPVLRTQTQGQAVYGYYQKELGPNTNNLTKAIAYTLRNKTWEKVE